MRPETTFQKIIRRAASLVCGLVAAAGAATPRVVVEYPLKLSYDANAKVALCQKPTGDGLALFLWHSFEDEPFSASLVVLQGDQRPFEVTGLWSAACDERWRRVAVGEEVKVIDNTTRPPYNRGAEVARELRLRQEELDELLYRDGFAGNAYVTRVVVYDLATGARTPVPFAGGDFVDWSGDDRLVVGRETGGSKFPARSALTLVGYNLKTKGVTPLSGPGDGRNKLGERLSAVAPPPYLPATWRPWSLGRAPEITCGRGAFVNGGGQVFWSEKDSREPIVSGTAVAASPDGSWLVIAHETAAGRARLVAVRLKWD